LLQALQAKVEDTRSAGGESVMITFRPSVLWALLGSSAGQDVLGFSPSPASDTDAGEGDNDETSMRLKIQFIQPMSEEDEEIHSASGNIGHSNTIDTAEYAVNATSTHNSDRELFHHYENIAFDPFFDSLFAQDPWIPSIPHSTVIQEPLEYASS
jgi:hypothetical protein